MNLKSTEETLRHLVMLQPEVAALEGEFSAFLESFSNLARHPFFEDKRLHVETGEHFATVTYLDVSLRFELQVQIPNDGGDAMGVVLCLLDCPMRTGTQQPWLLESFTFNRHGACELESDMPQILQMRWCARYVVGYCLELALRLKPSQGAIKS